jgi:hypothetical protein
MATNVQYLYWDNSTLANFKSWAQGIGTALSAFGWTLSATPTGTVNWSTLPYTPWTGNEGQGTAQMVPGGTLGTLNFRGAWSNASVAYATNDVVTNNNATWYCTTAYTTTASSPAPPFEWIAASTQHWTLLAFEVWKSAGTNPIYLRFIYCGGGPGGSLANLNVTPRIKVSVGTNVDANGNLNSGTGNVSAEDDLNFTANPTATWTPGQIFPCFFSGDSTNRFSMLMWPDMVAQGSVNGQAFFCIERSLTNAGSYNTTMSGIAFVQGQSDTYANHTNTISKTFTLNTTAGNTIVVFASNVGTSAAGIAISDSQTNSYTQFSAADLTVNALAQKGWYATGIAGGATTVTVTWTTGGTQSSALAIAEYQGGLTVDQVSTIKTGTGGAWSTNSVTTTQAWELLVTLAITAGGSTTATSNAVTRQTTNTPTVFGIIADAVVGTTGTFSSSGGGNSNYAAVMASFKASPNSAPVTPYWTAIWWGNIGVATGQGTIGSFVQTGPNTWITTQFDTKIWTVTQSGAHSQPPNNINEGFSSGSGNQSIPAFPIFPLVGWVGNPMTAVLSTKFQDAPAMGTFTTLLYGTSHTYLNVRGGSWTTFGNNDFGNVNGLAMRFD